MAAHDFNKSIYCASVMLFLAKNTTSSPCQGPPISLQTALILRLARFRQTAFPSFFPAIKATRPLVVSPWPH